VGFQRTSEWPPFAHPGTFGSILSYDGTGLARLLVSRGVFAVQVTLSRGANLL